MDEKTQAALREEMPSIVRYINRIIASNPDLRDAGLKYNGLLLAKIEPNPEIVTNQEVFREFIRPECQEFKFCTSDASDDIQIVICSDKNCPPGFHEE